MTTSYPTTFESDDEIIRAAEAIIANRWLEKKRSHRLFNAPAVAQEFFNLRLHGLHHEEFHVAVLDNQNRLLAHETCLFKGTINSCSVYPRVVIKRVLELNGAAVILAHNHPSGVVEPSRSDFLITTKLQEALKLIDVCVLDHVIVGDRTYSFVEYGQL
jgi:DNA repair protein RadC